MRHNQPRFGLTPVLRLISGLVLLVVLVLAALLVLGGPPEPKSHGHPLSYWLKHHLPTEADRRQAKQAEVAIREIGTNGLPALLTWLRYEPSQAKTNVQHYLARLRGTWYGRWVPRSLAYDHGVPSANIGFMVLGPEAAPAIPELERIANDAAHRGPAVRAMLALIAIGPQALGAVEARLSNTNFPFPADAAVKVYIQTRTGVRDQPVSPAMARSMLAELQTNRNPLLAHGATQVLKEMESPSAWERGHTKTFSEALSDLNVERRTGRKVLPGRAERAELRQRQQEQTNSAPGASATARPPTLPRGDEPYPYPLQPHTAAWANATLDERFESVEIPKAWRDHATSWQLFRSAIANPFFRVIHIPGYDIANSYKNARQGAVLILSEVDTAPDFGTNVLRWLSGLDLPKMADSDCEKWNEPCFLDYMVVCHMAGLPSALETMDVGSRQRLFRLAVWDADYFLSRGRTMVASAPIRLMYTIYKKPESFRGTLPREVLLPPLAASTRDLARGDTPQPEAMHSVVAAAKAALDLKQRP